MYGPVAAHTKQHEIFRTSFVAGFKCVNWLSMVNVNKTVRHFSVFLGEIEFTSRAFIGSVSFQVLLLKVRN